MSEESPDLPEGPPSAQPLEPADTLAGMWQAIQRLSPEPVSLKHLAARVGLSTKHVQRMLHGQGAVSDGARERVAHSLETWLRTLRTGEAPAPPPSAASAPAAVHAPRPWKATVLLAVLAAAVAVTPVARRRAPPTVAVHVPYRIDVNEADVFGTHRPPGDYRVVFYVFPEDEMGTYYRTCPPAEQMSAEAFQGRVRFGNAVPRDNEKLPLYFSVYAALVPTGGDDALPGTCQRPALTFPSHVAFREAVLAAGAVALSPPARTLRVPAAVGLRVEIVSPPPEGRVRSPVRLSWSPPLLLSREIWRRSSLVEEASGDDKTSGETVALEPGRYEIKLRERRTSRVVGEAFFDVLPESGD